MSLPIQEDSREDYIKVRPIIDKDKKSVERFINWIIWGNPEGEWKQQKNNKEMPF